MEQPTILTAAELRRQFLPAHSVGACEGQKGYYQFLTGKGLTVNPKIFLSNFRLKNGLPYVGMAAKEPIVSGEILIRIPEELVLCSAKALGQTELQQVFQDCFFINQNENWEDRVLIVYLMFLLGQKDEGNSWYHMALSFPQECDIACFWPKEDVDCFRDSTVVTAAAMDLQSFEEEWRDFGQCQTRYSVLQGEEFNISNYRRIFVSLTNRAFGKNFNFVSMIPFAEYFNHHCSKVYYTVEKEKRTNLKDEHTSDGSSSVGSYDSNEYVEEGEFAYDSFEVTPYNWEVDQSYELAAKQSQLIKKEVGRVMGLMESEVRWDDFTVMFVGHLMLKLKIAEKEFLVGRRGYLKAVEELKMVEGSLRRYRGMMDEYYRLTKKREYGKEEKQIKKREQKFVYPKYQKQYESVVLRTSSVDRFQPNSQIYFKYGHNSNRSLLLRYGFAIEGNKYEHVWISVSIKQCCQQFPDVLQKVMEKRLPLLRKFKIHHHILNMDIIIFFRLRNWNFYNQKSVDEVFQVMEARREIIVLEQVIQVLMLAKVIYEGDFDLTDEKLNYHQYFIRVYHKQKYSIIQKQIAMLNKLIIFLRGIEEGKKKEELMMRLTSGQKKIMKVYIDLIK